MSERVLDSVSGPEDVRRLPESVLPQLAREIREKIVKVVSHNGGHLASNLGTVELTIALLRVFSPPRDKVLFDVSHQSYAWKILTGRKDRFPSIRKTGGLSGFQKRSESDCDAFGSGHAGNSISAALGLAAARDIAGRDENVVAVIGDASIANGISLEALNNVRDTTGRLLIVLNDNKMSIGRSTGALSRAFGRMLASPRYNRWKSAVEDVGVKRLGMGWLREHYHALESRIKSLFLRRTNTLFESLGIRYVGPVDGHDISALVGAFEALKSAKEPVVLHVATEKGRGYEFAERDPEPWHGPAPFDPSTGLPVRHGCGVSWSKVFGDFLCEAAASDGRVFATTAGMESGTGLSAFAKKFPSRFKDVGICEEHQAIFAAGLAAGGLRPVVAVYSTFFQRALDPAIHDVALQNLPVVFALDRAGVVPGDGPTHHGIFDIAMLRAVPNFVVFAPRTPADLRRSLRTALSLSGPSAIRYPRGTAPDDSGEDSSNELLEIGRARVLSSLGASPKVAIWALGPEDDWSEKLAKLLMEKGIASVRVDPRFAKPLDVALLREQVSAGIQTFVTFEDGILAGGFGEGVASTVEEMGANVRTISFGWPDKFFPHATTREDLLQAAHLTPEDALEIVLSRTNLAASPK